jgi:hypothetical protein
MNRFDDLAQQYSELPHDTDLKRLDAALFLVREACAESGHAFNDRGVCEWCGDFHYSLSKEARRRLQAESNRIVSRIGKAGANGMFNAAEAEGE